MDKKEFDFTEERSDLSLLYPDTASQTASYKHTAGLSDDTAAQLELDALIDLSYSSISSFFTTDPAVIRYRQETFADLAAFPAICDILVRMLTFLNDITDLRKMYSDTEVGDSYLYSISEIEIYTSLMSMLKDELLPYKEQVTSPALKNFTQRISCLVYTSRCV